MAREIPRQHSTELEPIPHQQKASSDGSSTHLSDDSSPSTNDNFDQPSSDARLNGGFTAWSQVFVSFLLVFNGFGYFSSFGLFQSHWVESLNASPSDIAWILGAFSTSAVTKYWQLILAQGLVQGIGNGMLFTPCVALVSVYFDKGRAFALSLAACGAPIGGIVFPLISRQLSSTVGFPWTVRVMGFIMVFNTFLILALGRPRKFKKERRPLLEPAAFKEKVYLFYSIGIFFTLWGLYIAYFYTSTFGRKIIGLSDSDSLTLLLVLNAAGVPGRLVPAFIADRFFGPFNTMLPFVMGSSIMLLVWMRVETTSGFYAFVVLYGICANAVQTLFPSTLSSLVADPSKMGQRVGMVFGVGSLACLTGPPLAGVLVGVGNGSYTYMQLYGGLSVMVGFVFLGVSRLCQLRGW
ncbi:MFS monocarboxylate transporter [Metarhizium album ARSEF 1941]|uniref:MFS monocarboxylate transporter n=1 Tax=Metarhizium album (strain ARSEF 1941) TaxID=1081103 RepID=A0A0B2WMI8_METAS|nr:MFS monocarboxylate transporter [Metarhizium album ARSEF 1941]KHN94904.1 MFS monocarboxylate transporter [Metarhizium album ARSEF 1941]